MNTNQKLNLTHFHALGEKPNRDAPASDAVTPHSPYAADQFERVLLCEMVSARREISEAIGEERTNALLRVAARLASVIAAGDAEWEPLVVDALVSAATQIGLTADESKRTIASAWKAGSSMPSAVVPMR